MISSRPSVLWVLLLVTCSASERKFPPNFKFGAATSAYQVEGAWNVSDKAESIWDNYAHSAASKIKNRDTGDIACDSYHKLNEDIQMAVDLGLEFYRFSISWPRLLPTGFPNVISEAGKKYYSDLIDGLLAKGIEPVVTIYHWELPQRLQNFGGWMNPMITDWFADYARVVFSLYADRVNTWLTINEPLVMCDATYSMGTFAPGIEDSFANYICGKNTLIAHAKAWRIYDKDFKPKYKGRAAIVNVPFWFEADTPEDEDIAKMIRELSAGLYTHPIYSKNGGWPPAIENFIAEKSEKEGYQRSRLPAFTEEEIELVKGTYDFFPFNYFSGRIVRKAKVGETIGNWPFGGVPELGGVMFARLEWKPTGKEFTKVYSKGLRKLLLWTKENYGDMEFIIMENGVSSKGYNLNDLDRISFIEEHLEQILLAIKEDGINVTGYAVWSLMDCLEWDFGYSIKYGLYEVNFEDASRPRTPRASAHYYAAVIKNRSLDVNITAKNENNSENNSDEL